jgi:hypothetical protein
MGNRARFLVASLVACLALACGPGPSGEDTARAIETEDPRFEMWLASAPSTTAGDAKAVRLRMDAKAGWHMTPEAPTQLDLSAPAGVELVAPSQRIADAVDSSPERLEFLIAYRLTPTQTALRDVSVDGRLKFGICRDGKPRCEIVERKLRIPLALD